MAHCYSNLSRLPAKVEQGSGERGGQGFEPPAAGNTESAARARRGRHYARGQDGVIFLMEGVSGDLRRACIVSPRRPVYCISLVSQPSFLTCLLSSAASLHVRVVKVPSAALPSPIKIPENHTSLSTKMCVPQLSSKLTKEKLNRNFSAILSANNKRFSPRIARLVAKFATSISREREEK